MVLHILAENSWGNIPVWDPNREDQPSVHSPLANCADMAGPGTGVELGTWRNEEDITKSDLETKAPNTFALSKWSEVQCLQNPSPEL